MSSSNNTKQNLQPKLRFPEFRDAGKWEEKPLKNFCRIQTGKKDANEGAEGGKYPFFTCADKHIYSDSYSFDTEAILVAGNANVGQTRYYNGKFEAYQRTYVLNCFAGIDITYLFTLLSANLRNSLLEQAQTSAMSYIKLPMLQEYLIAFPSYSKEQQKIADCLSSLDVLIAAQGQKVEALKAHKKGLMQELFPAEGETLPKLRFPEFRDAPKWEEKTISTICHQAFSGGTPITTEKNYYGGDIPFIRSAEIAKSETELFLTKEGLSNSAARMVGKGDVLVALYGANSGDVALSQIDGAINQAILCLKSDYNEFIYQFLSHRKSWIVAKYIQGGQGNLSGEIVRSIKLSRPTQHEEQKRIADCLSSLDELITAQSQKLDALRQYKKGLMQQLFPSPEDVEA
jgi:type I restriction enzyme S subunit